MIILGERYHFTEIETKILNKKFNSIDTILYKNFSTDENIKQLTNLLDNNRIIVLNTKATIELELLKYLTSLEKQGIEYLTIEKFMERYLDKIIITGTSFDIQYLEGIYQYTVSQKIQKRIIDFIGIVILLLPTLFALIYSFLKIKKESPGPLLFKQKRIGYNENEFICIKLRSMHLDSEIDGPKFAVDNDPRSFPWGATIRYTKIDELLQLWNVFVGEMHLIGPRPERKIWVQEFKKSIPYYNQRHIVPPGITGLAQIRYHYGSGEVDAKAKLEYDLFYIKNWSLKLELSIIWETTLFIIQKLQK
ncbi:MAG: sugar transferase [Sulfurovaceae bacterium]|nr:sugar transferase [Sulfurovaceae bacterium]